MADTCRHGEDFVRAVVSHPGAVSSLWEAVSRHATIPDALAEYFSCLAQMSRFASDLAELVFTDPARPDVSVVLQSVAGKHIKARRAAVAYLFQQVRTDHEGPARMLGTTQAMAALRAALAADGEHPAFASQIYLVLGHIIGGGYLDEATWMASGAVEDLARHITYVMSMSAGNKENNANKEKKKSNNSTRLGGGGGGGGGGEAGPSLGGDAGAGQLTEELILVVAWTFGQIARRGVAAVDLLAEIGVVGVLDGLLRRLHDGLAADGGHGHGHGRGGPGSSLVVSSSSPSAAAPGDGDGGDRSSYEVAKERVTEALMTLIDVTSKTGALEGLVAVAAPSGEILLAALRRLAQATETSVASRRSFVSSGGLMRLQRLLPVLDEDGCALAQTINQQYPEDVVAYYQTGGT